MLLCLLLWWRCGRSGRPVSRHFPFLFFCFVVLFRLSADNDTASETMENWAVVPFFLFSFSHEMSASLCTLVCVCVSCIFYPSVKRARESFAYRLSSPDSFSPRHNADTARASWKRTDELLEWDGQLLASRNASSSGIDWHYSTTTQKEPL